MAAALAGLLLLVTACSRVPGVYVVEHGDEGSAAGGGATAAFDAKAYVDGIWATKVVPTLRDTAHDAGPVVRAIAADPAAAAAQYGRQAGSGGPATFVVRGTGTVVAVDTEAVTGTLAVDLAPADGTPDLALSIGPALLGTAVRDALPFVDFSQFTNQIDYADVSTALNARVKTDVIGAVDVATAKGRTVTFVGAFADVDHKTFTVTPVALQVAP